MRPWPSSAAAGWATPRSWGRRWPVPARSSPWTSMTRSWSGPGASAPPTPSTLGQGDPVEAIQALTDGLGVDVAIEAIGLPQTFVQAFNARDLAGRLVLVGVPSPEAKVELPMIEIFGRGGSTKSSWYGDCLPTRDFPLLIDMHLSGRIDLGHVRQRDHPAGRGRGGVPQDGAGRGAALGRRPLMALRIDNVVTSGIFTLDGEDFEVDNNIWLVGDDDEVIVVDAAHDHRPIVAGVGLPTGGGRGLHPRPQRPHQRRRATGRGGRGADLAPPRRPDAVGRRLAGPGARTPSWPTGRSSRSAGSSLEVLHTPGHSPGGCCLTPRPSGVVFSGDTLFNGGPGATGRSFSDYDTIVASIRNRLLDAGPGDGRAHRPRRRHDDRRGSRRSADW